MYACIYTLKMCKYMCYLEKVETTNMGQREYKIVAHPKKMNRSPFGPPGKHKLKLALQTARSGPPNVM
jgi:hypothetical protein